MGPSEARLKVFGAPFFKKARPCPYGRQPKKKPATGADAPVRAIATGAAGVAGGLPSQSPNGDSSPKGGAKYVRYQKLAQSQVSPPPLGEVSCLWHDGEGNPLAPRTIPCPPAVAYTKGRYTLGAVGQESTEETSVASKMPSRNPRRGFLTENSPQDYFPIFLRLLTL